MNTLVERLRDVLSRPLPGLDAQIRMAPRPRMGWDPAAFPEGLRVGAALLLIYPFEGSPHLPLTVRASGLRHHTGQVSLPGGRVDRGESVEAAALREASEEIGLEPSNVHIVGGLTPLHIPVSGFLLHPVVGVSVDRPVFRPAPGEVARLLEVPVSHLTDPGIVKEEWRVREREGAPTPVEVPYFAVEGEKVWGATAMVLAEFLAIWQAVATET